MNPRESSHGSRPAPQEPRLAFRTLEQAAAELGTSIQGLIVLLRDQSIEIRRFAHGSRTLSGISSAELEVLRGALDVEQAPAPAGGFEDSGLEQRLRETELALEEARLDQEVARSACDQLARVSAEAEVSGRRAVELVGRLRQLEGQLARSAERIAALEGREGELGRELARTREAAAARQAELERELETARELEVANGHYIDQVEKKLAAANATIAGLHRRPA